MATVTKKKRFNEAELIDQNETQAQPVPATDAEMAQAAPAEPAPMEAAPAEEAPAEEAVLPEGTDEGGVEVNPETVSVQVQIPVDQLGAAVAQATGDMEVANLSPDVESAQEAELVAGGAEGEEGVPVEGAIEEAPAEMGGEEGVEPQLESKKVKSSKRFKEDVFADNSEVEGIQSFGAGDGSDEDYQSGKVVAKEREDEYDEMISQAIDKEEKNLKEFLNFGCNTTVNNSQTANLEGKVAADVKTGDNAVGVGGSKASVGGDNKMKESEEAPDVVPVDDVDDLPPGMEGEDADFDIDALGGEDGPEFAASNEFDVEIDENDPAVQDFLSRIDDYLADEEAQPAQVADALRASADFFDAIAPEEEDIDEEDLLDVEEGEDEGEIDLDLDAITGYKGEGGHAKTGDDVLDQFAELPEESEDYEESLVRVPCKFPKKRFGEKRAPRELPLVRENRKIKEAVEDDFEEDEDWDAWDEFDHIADEWGSEKALRELLRFISNYDPDLITNFVDEVKSGRWGSELYAESKKSVGKKFKENVDYSAVKFPAGSEGTDDNLVEAYEKTQTSRRKAIKNFRESVIRDDENRNIGVPSSRFNEALRSSVRMNSRSSNSGSWADNKFLDKYNESQELDFKKLISEGFLG